MTHFMLRKVLPLSAHNMDTNAWTAFLFFFFFVESVKVKENNKAHTNLVMHSLLRCVAPVIVLCIFLAGIERTAAAVTPPLFPPQVRASLVGHCFGFDAFNCPEMYIGRSFTSMAYFDYAGMRLREDDLFSVNGSAASFPNINFERVYGANLNATHVSITLFYILSNETRVPLQCVEAVYPGQMNSQNFMENATLVHAGVPVPGRSDNITADMWLVNVPPAYRNIYFFTGPIGPGSNNAHNDSGKYDRVFRIEAQDGSFYVDYYDYVEVTIFDSTLTPPYSCS